MAEIDAAVARANGGVDGRLRVVLDTNVLVSGLAYPASVPGRILSAWKQGALSGALAVHSG